VQFWLHMDGATEESIDDDFLFLFVDSLDLLEFQVCLLV